MARVVGVLSDTHGNRGMMFDAATALTQTHGAEFLFHLGDNYADADELRSGGHTVFAVPGLYCPEYGRASVPKRLTMTLDRISFACAHVYEALSASERSADVVLHGHTHKPEIVVRGGKIRFNPGHLAAEHSRGHPASYGLIVVEPERLWLRVLRMSGKAVLEHEQPI